MTIYDDVAECTECDWSISVPSEFPKELRTVHLETNVHRQEFKRVGGEWEELDTIRVMPNAIEGEDPA